MLSCHDIPPLRAQFAWALQAGQDLSHSISRRDIYCISCMKQDLCVCCSNTCSHKRCAITKWTVCAFALASQKTVMNSLFQPGLYHEPHLHWYTHAIPQSCTWSLGIAKKTRHHRYASRIRIMMLSLPQLTLCMHTITHHQTAGTVCLLTASQHYSFAKHHCKAKTGNLILLSVSLNLNFRVVACQEPPVLILCRCICA